MGAITAGLGLFIDSVAVFLYYNADVRAFRVSPALASARIQAGLTASPFVGAARADGRGRGVLLLLRVLSRADDVHARVCDVPHGVPPHRRVDGVAERGHRAVAPRGRRRDSAVSCVWLPANAGLCGVVYARCSARTCGR